ncbi:MAG: AMP-binding protein, partial [Frankiales bacterium]|nr:AMP-binding protein [Frankiales bacterium]
MDISAWISYWAACSPEKAAVRFDGRALTYRGLEERVGRLAGVLGASGVAAGDRVAYLGPSCPEILEALFACARVGALLVPLNARMPVAELAVFLSQCQPRLLLAEVGLKGTAHACAERVVVFSAGDGIAPHSAGTAEHVHSRGDAELLILYTSGTTGRPKGAVLTNDAVTANAIAAVTGLQLTGADH